MYPIKKNVLQTVALLKAYGIHDIVLSPGSRNAPLIQAFSQDMFFSCQVIVDERHAAFYALGIIQHTQQPVAICCTSGSAVLNYAAAVAEAYYQELPLLVISADRAQEWIGQMDGQTLPQPNVFGDLIKKSVNLPEIVTIEDEWFCNRLINEALIALTTNVRGPVHINIPLSEPLFDYSAPELPQVRKIANAIVEKRISDINYFSQIWNNVPRKMIVVGQMLPNPNQLRVLEQLAVQSGCVICSEHLANLNSKHFVHNFDAILSKLSAEEREEYRPELLVTFGGHLVSKRMKQFLRERNPLHHWHISPSGQVIDLFQSLTDLLPVDQDLFLSYILEKTSLSDSIFSNLWFTASKAIIEPQEQIFSDLFVTKCFFKSLPSGSYLHLGNSSSVRNAQLFELNDSVSVYCNRGVNGIEGTVSTAIGFASVCDKPVYLLVGDLSFFYGLNAFWNVQHICNLRILLINNGGGGIFHLLPGLKDSESLKSFVAAEHRTNAQKWVDAAEMRYLRANNIEELKLQLTLFFETDSNKSVVLEAIVDMDICKQAVSDYYQKLKENK